MASILKIGDGWRAQVRRKGHKSVTETFTTKAQAVKWAREVEVEMDSKRFKDARGLANITLKALIDRYREEIGAEHPFGKNKTPVLNTWSREHGDVALADITDDYLTTFVRNRRKGGVGGVIGMSMKTAYNQRSARTFPIPMAGDPLHADIRDVAAYMDELRANPAN